MKWDLIALSELVEFPPKVSLERDELYDNIPMDAVNGGIKYVQEINQRVYTGGGAKFGNGDTIFARITPCLENGKISKVKGLEKGVGFGSTEFFVFRAKEKISDPDFVYYLAKTDLVRQPAIKSMVGASGRQRADKGVVEQIKVPKIPLPTQRKIASILSAYDDLIENNHKRIKLLEEKALMEFRKLYRNSILAEYPIEDVWEIKYGKNLPQIKITETGKYPVYGASGRIGYYEEYNYEFPVALVTSRGNGSGNAHRTNQTAFVTNNSFAFVPRANFSDVHFHLAEMILRELNLTQLRSGTAQPQLTIAGLVGVKLMLPAKDLLIVFNKVVDSVFELIFSLEKQNAKLIEARDILLPRLMSGQIEV
jgi:type I restriction enzyme S subunit